MMFAKYVKQTEMENLENKLAFIYSVLPIKDTNKVCLNKDFKLLNDGMCIQ